MRDQLFADGIGAISVIGGTVRIDFVSLSPTETDAQGQPKTVPQCRLVMTIPAFLHCAPKLQEAIEAVGKIKAASTGPVKDAEAGTDNSANQTVHAFPSATINKMPKPPFP